LYWRPLADAPDAKAQSLDLFCETSSFFASQRRSEFFKIRPMKATTLSTHLSKRLLLIPLFACSLLISAQAVSPPPDGGYPEANTAEGQNALFSLTTGVANTAVGWLSLNSVDTGKFNTAIGAGTLIGNTADQNTATGVGALFNNGTGEHNTANGAFALFDNLQGSANAAIGAGALLSNTNGFRNTATGSNALLGNTTGSDNTALGYTAGSNQDTGSANVYIGAGMVGVSGESNACYIKSIFGQTSASGIPVLINSSNKLGTTTSSQRFKEDIKSMDKASEELLALRPVTFHYKKEIDPAGTAQFGLVAEEVEKVNPDLIVRDQEGKPYSVRYDQVNAMLLNEFLKEHRKVEELEANAARQQKQIERLTAGLQKVSAQLEASKPAPQVVDNP
jgi:Chaperone of endosialidase